MFCLFFTAITTEDIPSYHKPSFPNPSSGIGANRNYSSSTGRKKRERSHMLHMNGLPFPQTSSTLNNPVQSKASPPNSNEVKVGEKSEVCSWFLNKN